MKRLRRAAALVVLAGIVAGCATSRPASMPVHRVSPDYQPPQVRLYALERVTSMRPVPMIDPPSPDPPVAVPPGTPIGTVQPRPKRLSQRHHDTIVRAEALYAAGGYRQAAELLAPAYRDEPDNPFVAEAYAKALYRQNRREQAFAVYERLVRSSDHRLMAQARRRHPHAAPDVFVDHWLIDAYWKKGTLHMDREEWDKAAFEISRAYGQMNDPRLVDQALSYLTKAFFNLGRYDVARYYGEAALEHNPDNGYVRPYMAELGKDPARQPVPRP